MRSIIIIGASSMLAKHFCSLKCSYYNIVLVYRDSVYLDGVKHDDLESLVTLPADVLYCASGFNSKSSHSSVEYLNREKFMFESHTNVLKALDISKFIFVSSGGSFYKTKNEFPVTEAGEADLTSAYNSAKLYGERYFGEFFENFYSLRVSNIFGSKFHSSSSIGFIDLMIKENSSQYFTKPTLNIFKDWIHIDEVVRCIDFFINTQMIPPGVFNLGSGVSYGTMDIYDKFKTGAKKELSPTQGEYSLNVKKLKKLGFSPQDFLNSFLNEVITTNVTKL